MSYSEAGPLRMCSRGWGEASPLPSPCTNRHVRTLRRISSHPITLHDPASSSNSWPPTHSYWPSPHPEWPMGPTHAHTLKRGLFRLSGWAAMNSSREAFSSSCMLGFELARLSTLWRLRHRCMQATVRRAAMRRCIEWSHIHTHRGFCRKKRLARWVARYLGVHPP